MTKEIQLTRGQVTVVDDIDYEYLMQWGWCARPRKCKGTFDVQRTEWLANKTSKSVQMHREVAQRAGICLSGDIDHIDRDPLNNQRSNLRCSTRQQTTFNKDKHCNNTTGFKGVTYSKRKDRWIARIGYNTKKYLGSFESPILAAIAYNNAARELHGEFAVLNVIPNPQPHE